ncbi:Uncharacterized protein FWK35_00005494, partial [Aphis craccivora]
MNVLILQWCVITSPNNTSILKFGVVFEGKRSKVNNFQQFLKKIEKNKKKLTEKREFLRKTYFRPNRFFFIWFVDKKCLDGEKNLKI